MDIKEIEKKINVFAFSISNPEITHEEYSKLREDFKVTIREEIKKMLENCV